MSERRIEVRDLIRSAGFVREMGPVLGYLPNNKTGTFRRYGRHKFRFVWRASDGAFCLENPQLPIERLKEIEGFREA